MTKKELAKLLDEAYEKALNIHNGYVAVTKDGDIWTYSSEPYSSNNIIAGLTAQKDRKGKQEWIDTVVFYYENEK